MAFVRVTSVSRIPANACREFAVGKRRVLICAWRGRYYALSPMCSHEGNSLDGAAVWDGLLDCPWHHFQFDVETGENRYPKCVYPTDRPDLTDSVRALRTFALEVRGNDVYVDLSQPSAAHEPRAR